MKHHEAPRNTIWHEPGKISNNTAPEKPGRYFYLLIYSVAGRYQLTALLHVNIETIISDIMKFLSSPGQKSRGTGATRLMKSPIHPTRDLSPNHVPGCCMAMPVVQ